METRETYEQQQERLAAKAAAAKWPEGLEVPKAPKLKLSGTDGNVFAILGKAQRKAKEAKWTDEQIEAFMNIARAGSYDHAIQTCMRYFDVR